MNSETTTGYLFETLDASLRKWSSSVLLDTIFIAAPERTYEGLTSTGNPIVSTNFVISSIVVSSFHLGWSISSSSHNEENLCLSSALSIETADVPRIFIPLLYNLGARLFGICPPVETITPFGFSSSIISITLS